MKIITGRNATELREACRNIQELCKFIGNGKMLSEDIEISLNNAISEAMTNVAKHAYPATHPFKHKHVNRWWITASADRKTAELTIIIYDQGASIPVTLALQN